MSSLIQRSLSGGEIDPALWPRSDTTKYATGLRTLRNAVVRRNGGAFVRPATAKCAAVKSSSDVARLIPFIFNATQTYVLEFGANYIRVYKNGSQVLAQGATAYAGGTAYSIGKLVTSGGITYYCCYNGIKGLVYNSVKFAQNATLLGIAAPTQSGNTPASNPADWYALTNGIYEIPSPYAAADLSGVRFDQNGNDLILTHPLYPVFRLTKTVVGGNDVFALYLYLNGSKILGTISVTNDQGDSNSFSPGGAGVFTYAVSGVSKLGDEAASNPGTDTVGSPLTTTKTVAATGAKVTLSWGTVANAVTYNIWKQNPNGVYGFIGSTANTSFIDDGITPDFANPWVQDIGQLFGGDGASGNLPACCAFYQQRLFFGNTPNAPTKVWGSQTGLYDNFNINVPSVDTDSLSFSMAGNQDVIQHLLYLGVLIVFTYGTENSIQGDASGALSPSSINPKRESVHGSSSLRPLIVGDNAVYNQANGSVVRDLGFNFQVDGYRGDDLTVFATHLFDNYTLLDWAYQVTPNSVIWAVRSDGTLLAMTYVREQQILAWSHHDTTAGVFENVCVVPEGNQSAVYVVVKRTINGSVVRFVERMYNQFTNVIDFVGMDCATTFDGRNTSNDTVTLSGGTLWNETELLTATLNANNFYTFVTGDATNNNRIFITGSDGKLVRFKITSYSSATVVQGFVDRTVPSSLQGVATKTWSHAIRNLTGLSYLEGQNLSVFADGYVVGSPNNAAYPVYTVASGNVTLDKHYAVIHVGLPITSDIETLDIDSSGPQDPQGDRFKLINRVTLHMVNSRSVFIGSQNPDTDLANTTNDPLYRLTELKLRQNEAYDSPMNLVTGKVTQNIQGSSDANGHVFIRHVDPAPLLIAAIAPEGLYPMRGA